MQALHFILILSGTALSLCAVVAMLFLPWSLGHFHGEPEDTWALAACAIVSGVPAALCFLAARAINKRTSD